MAAFRELKDPVIFIGNHMSTLETFVLPWIILPHRPLTFVVKRELLGYPLFPPGAQQVVPTRALAEVEEAGAGLPKSFSGEVRMRTAWAFMDLERYDQALELLDTEAMEPYLDHFRDDVLYEYFFSYANTLGALSKQDAMDQAMRKAIFIAAERMNDLQRCVRAWMNLMLLSEHNKWWQYLDKVSAAAQSFSSNQGPDLDALWILAGIHRLSALGHTGKPEQAEELGRELRNKAESLGDSDMKARVDEALENFKA